METAPIDVYEEFSDEIWPGSSEALLAKMTEHASHGERVGLTVSAPGGQVASGIALHRQLLLLPLELTTYNTGEVASMGNLVFLTGERRLAVPEATFLVHPIASIDTGVPMDADAWRRARTRFERRGDQSRVVEISERISYLDAKEGEVREIFKERTKLTSSEIAELVRKGQAISATEALEA